MVLQRTMYNYVTGRAMANNLGGYQRWTFNEDNSLAVGSEGYDEQDHVLLDNFDSRFPWHAITLLHEQDQLSL